MSERAWRFWVDRGGTFTDLIGCDPRGTLHIRKVLSEGGEDDPAVQVMRELLATCSIDGIARDAPATTSPGSNAAQYWKLEPFVPSVSTQRAYARPQLLVMSIWRESIKKITPMTIEESSV